MKADDFRQSLDTLAGADPSVDDGLARVTKRVRVHRVRKWSAVATACVVVIAVATVGVVRRDDSSTRITLGMPAPQPGGVADFTWKRVPLPRDMTINRIVSAEGRTFAVGSFRIGGPAIGVLDANRAVSQLVNPASGNPGHLAVLLLPPAGTVNDLVAFRGALVAVGSMTTAAGPIAAVWRSTDGGHTWQTASIEPRPRGTAQSVNIRRALVSGDTITLLGTPGFPASANIRQGADQCPVYVWTSSDGRDFQAAPPFEDCGRTFVTAASGPGGLLFVNGDTATSWRRSGNAWLPTSIASTTPASKPRIDDIGGSERGYVAVGTVHTDGDSNDISTNRVTGVIWWSPDGRKWEQVATTVDPRKPSNAFLTSVAYSPAGWIATGWRSQSEFGRGSDEAIVYTSADGRHWTPSTRDGDAFEQFSDAESVGVTADGFAIRGVAELSDLNEVLWLGSKADVATGTVDGTMREVGGRGVDRPVPGTVVATGPNREPQTAKIDAAGAFSIDLAPGGDYSIVGHSPLYGSGKYTCHGSDPGPVGVQAKHVTHVDLTCQVR